LRSRTSASAYNGAAPLIRNSSILAAAAGIGLTEAQHAGVLRYLVYDRNIHVPQLDAADVPPLVSASTRFVPCRTWPTATAGQEGCRCGSY